MTPFPNYFSKSPWEEKQEGERMKLLWQDLLIGFIYGLVSYFAIGYWCLLLAGATSILWALGGAGWLGSILWRRLGCPIVLTSAFLFTDMAGHDHWLKIITLPMQFGAFSLGYGLPSNYYPYDQGSWLGKIFGKWTRVVWFSILAVAMTPLFYK